MKPLWIVHEELLFYIKEICLAWHQFDASWDAIDNCKMSKKEKEEMEGERETFLGTSIVKHDDIETFLLGNNGNPCQNMIQTVTFVLLLAMLKMLKLVMPKMLKLVMPVLTIDRYIVFIFLTRI